MISASQSQKTAISPFEQITKLEEEQELRVEHALARFAEEEEETRKAVASSEKFQEEKLREEAKEELRDYANKEPAAILKASEAETVKASQDIESSYNARASKLMDELLQSVVDFTFLPSR